MAKKVLVFLFTLIVITGCDFPGPSPEAIPASDVQITRDPEKTPVPQIVSSKSAPTNTNEPEPVIWIDNNIPESIRNQLIIPEKYTVVQSNVESDLRFTITQDDEPYAVWIYALVAPFPTILDDIAFDELVELWGGKFQSENKLFISQTTRNILETLWGEPDTQVVQVLDENLLLDQAWSNPSSLAIVPFEKVEPRWKVIRIDGQSPISNKFDIDSYPLKVLFGFTGPGTARVELGELSPSTPSFISNRDPESLTVVALTGVTALTRATAARMEEKGINYPARDIRDWLIEPDFTHISNEVSFDPKCPAPNPNQGRLLFCSKPEYFELLEYIEADVIELTGNHLMDWTYAGFLNTLDLIQQNEMIYYAGGLDIQEAKNPVLIEHNGNQLAFIGCNHTGPEMVWATEERAGNAPCRDFVWLHKEIGQLKSQGYQPIVTVQYNETYYMEPTPNQILDLDPLVESGAVIVSGSQSHFPQGMAFLGDGFIHYGLGNLFFDQMDRPVQGTRRAFIDYHVFYEGRYISTEIRTTLLEDYARPRPMTEEERGALLEEAFSASGWERSQFLEEE